MLLRIPHRPPGPGAMFGQRDRWAAFQALYTFSSPHTLLYIHKLVYFLFNAFHGTYILLACTLCNIKRKVFLYNFALNSIVLLEASNEGLVLVMHFMFTWLRCISIVYRLQVALIQCFDVELRVISTGYCKEYFYSIG